MWVGYHEFPNDIDPMMLSTWLSICAKCYILVQRGVKKVA
jgi:hypothetical protein